MQELTIERLAGARVYQECDALNALRECLHRSLTPLLEEIAILEAFFLTPPFSEDIELRVTGPDTTVWVVVMGGEVIKEFVRFDPGSEVSLPLKLFPRRFSRRFDTSDLLAVCRGVAALMREGGGELRSPIEGDEQPRSLIGDTLESGACVLA